MKHTLLRPTVLCLTDELLPVLVSLADDLVGELGVLIFSVKRKLVLRLAVRDLVDAEPLAGGGEEAGHHTLHVSQGVHLPARE